MSFPIVSIVILNWNGWEDTIECLESVYKISYPNYEIIVVDNNSSDNSLEKIKEYANGTLELNYNFLEGISTRNLIEIFEYDETELDLIEKEIDTSLRRLFLIKNNANYGYAKGNNIGVIFAIRNLNPSYILLLNNDTVVEKNFLEKMIEFAEKDRDICIIGPKVYYYDFPNKIQVTSTKINYWRGTAYLIGDGEIDIGQFDQVRGTDSVPGSCFLFKSKLINEIGLFNPKYKCYWEETDYCTSAKKKGYKSVYFPHSKVWHKVSKSTNKVSGLLIYYMTRNMFWFMKQHADTLHLLVFLLFFFGLKFWYIMINYFVNNRYSDFRYFLKGVKDGIK